MLAADVPSEGLRVPTRERGEMKDAADLKLVSRRRAPILTRPSSLSRRPGAQPGACGRRTTARDGSGAREQEWRMVRRRQNIKLLDDQDQIHRWDYFR